MHRLQITTVVRPVALQFTTRMATLPLQEKRTKGLQAVALDYMLNRVTKNTILQTDLLKAVSERTGSSVESVWGTVIGAKCGKLMSHPEFNKVWKYVRGTRKGRTRFVRRGSGADTRYREYKITYDTPTKQKAREIAFSELFQLATESPRVLTMASREGLCVRRILQHFPNCRITNIENDERTLKEFQSLGLPTNDVLSDIAKFVEDDLLLFDFLYLDFDGYFSASKYYMFKAINEKTTASSIAITLQWSERLRNTGHFAKRVRKELADDENPVQTLIEEALSNYEITKVYPYKRDRTSRYMFVLVFRRRETCDTSEAKHA